MRPVSGLAILSLNPSLQMKLTDDYAAGNTDAHKSPVDERYRLFVPVDVNFRFALTSLGHNAWRISDSTD
jgi:hypothetical protein